MTISRRSTKEPASCSREEVNMPEWTKPAREALKLYLTEVRASLAQSGADADEVVSDLGRHIDEEIADARLSVVTEHDVRRILARMGEPEPGAVEAPAVGPRRPPDELNPPIPRAKPL